MSGGHLFDLSEVPVIPGAPEGENLSYGQRLTIRRKADLAAGRHPVTKLPLLPAEQGLTCKTCTHHRVARWAGTYHKCALRDTGSEASDIRVSWPACTSYEPEPADESKGGQ